MDKVKGTEGAKNFDPSKRRTINPAVLGVPSSHGIKLSSTMTSHDKIELLSKLEEWRKARREKLANTILAKQKQVEKPKAFPMLPPKDRTSVLGHSSGDLNTKENVFERLYKNTAKVKKPENVNPSKVPQPLLKSKIPKCRISMPGNLKPLSTNVTDKLHDAVSISNSNEFLKNVANNEEETVDIPVEKHHDVYNEGVKADDMVTYEAHEVVNFPCEISIQLTDSDSRAVKEKESLEEISEQDSYKEAAEEEEGKEVFNVEITETRDVIQDMEKFTNVTTAQETVIEEENTTNSEEMAEIQSNTEEVAKAVSQRIMENEETGDNTQFINTTFAVEQQEIVNTEALENSFCNIEQNNEQGNSTFMISQAVADLNESGNVDNHKYSSLKMQNDEKSVESNPDKKPENKIKSEICVVRKPSVKVVPKKLEIRKSFSNLPKRASIKSQPVKPVNNEKPKLRRSVSMLYRNKRSTESAIHRTFSEKSLHELEKRETRPLSPFLESESETNVKTPVKSVCFNTPKNTKLITPSLLRNKLEDWLKNNGHPLESYRHLRCFGITTEAKPFVRTPAKVNKTKREAFHRLASPKTPVDDSDKENVTPPTAIKTVEDSDVENWLTELHRLITELKYPFERCEEWLAAIRSKCATCSQMPIYWECLAALNESKGENKSAQKKNTESEGDSLADLFDKMVIEQQKPSKPKLENGIDPKNIFKSTVFKFALQQKPLKESTSNSQEQFVATPVRRSSRIQKTPHKPYVVTSLQSLTPEVREKVKFKPNQSLIS